MKGAYDDWDQNIKTLGTMLFPDPSKVAHGYYYGSEARKAQLESVRLQNQMAAQNAQLGMQFGRNLPPGGPTYRPGFGDTAVMNDPSFAIPAAPGPTAPPAAPGQPVPPVQALPTLGAAMTTMQPQAQANAVVAGVENNASSGPGPEPTGSNGTVPQNGPGTFRPGSVTSAGGGGVVMAPPGAADGTPAPASVNMGQMIALGIAAGQTPDQAYATARGTLGNMVKNGQMALPLAEQMAAFYGAPQMRVQTQTNEGNLAVGAQTQAGATQRTAMEQAGATQRTGMTEAGATQRTGMTEAGATQRTGMTTTFVPDPDPVKAAQGAGSYVPLIQQQGPGGYRGTNPTAVSATVTPGQYLTPNGAVTTTTAGQAVAQGLPAAATSGDQQAAILRQRIQAPDTPPEERQRLIQQAQQLAATPKELDPDKQLAQQKFDYRTTQRIYSVPQKGVYDKFGINDPSAFDNAADTEIDRRAYELSQKSGNAYLRSDPAKAREAAIHDLMKNPTAEGFRLPTPAEVAAQRRPTRQRVATLGAYGDARLDDFTNPNVKGAEPTPHMMIRMVPKDYKPAAGEPAKGAPAATTTAPISTVIPPASRGALSGAPPSPSRSGMPAAPAPTVAAQASPTAPQVPAAPASAPQSFQQRLGAIFSGQTPSGPIFGAPSSAGPAVAPAAAVPADPVARGAPPGAIGMVSPDTPEGATVYGPSGPVGVNRGGWVYAQ